MRCAVNLLPISCRHAHTRAARRRVWTAACAMMAAALIGIWGVLGASDAAVDRARQRLLASQMAHTDIERQLAVAAGRRTELLERARTLAALERAHPLPGDVAVLSAAAPEGIVLTELIVRNGSAAPAGRQPPSARPTSDAPFTLEMSGFAVSHEEVTRLIAAVRAAGAFGEIELIQASREPLHDAEVIAFKLGCRVGPEGRASRSGRVGGP